MVSICLRQSIEIKTKRIFGIYKITKKRRNLPDFGFKRLFNFIENNIGDIEYNTIDFSILKSIYSWSCKYIHNGEISHQWQNETAMNYMSTIFKWGNHSHNGKITHSAFGAFKIRNFQLVKQRLIDEIGNDYIIEFVPDSQVEAIIIKPIS